MTLQNDNNDRAAEAEKLFKDSIEELGNEKLQVAQILFKKASIMGHKEAARFVEILSRCRGIEKT